MSHNPVGISNIGINRRRYCQFRQPCLERLLKPWKNFVKSKTGGRKNFVKMFLTFNRTSVKIVSIRLTVKSWFTLASITAQNPPMALLKNALNIKNCLVSFSIFVKIQNWVENKQILKLLYSLMCFWPIIVKYSQICDTRFYFDLVTMKPKTKQTRKRHRFKRARNSVLNIKSGRKTWYLSDFREKS